MTKNDWLVLFLRITGLYFLITHFSVLVTGLIGVGVFFNQKGPMRMELFPWQMPIAAVIVVLAGVTLLTKARPISKWIEKFDK